MKKTERTTKQKVASAHSTLYCILGFLCILGVDTHWVFALFAVGCFITCGIYDKLSHE